MDQKKYLQTLHFNKQTKEGLTMNKLLNNSWFNMLRLKLVTLLKPPVGSTANLILGAPEDFPV